MITMTTIEASIKSSHHVLICENCETCFSIIEWITVNGKPVERLCDYVSVCPFCGAEAKK